LVLLLARRLEPLDLVVGSVVEVKERVLGALDDALDDLAHQTLHARR
jgi:hypothetical protein